MTDNRTEAQKDFDQLDQYVEYLCERYIFRKKERAYLALADEYGNAPREDDARREAREDMRTLWITTKEYQKAWKKIDPEEYDY